MTGSRLPHLRQGQGRVLVLVHGFLGGARQWQAEIDRFSRHYDVIAPNLPGFGSAADWRSLDSIGAMADQIIALLDQLGVEQFDLLGHSMGGMIVQDIARKQGTRVERLILYGTGPLGLMPDRFETITQSKERFQDDGLETTVRAIIQKWFVKGEAHPGYEQLVEIGCQASIQAAIDGLDAMSQWDGRDHLSQLFIPTLILWGEADQSYRWPQVEALWHKIPHAHLAVMPNCSHVIHLEKPQLFHLLIEDFMQSR